MRELPFGPSWMFLFALGAALTAAPTPSHAPAQPGPHERLRQGWPITVQPGRHGTIVPLHPALVPNGGSLRLRVIARPGYHLDSLVVDGEPVRAVEQLTLHHVT